MVTKVNTTVIDGINSNVSLANNASFLGGTPAANYALGSDFTGTNQSRAVDGYQKFPGGLIVQWGVSASLAQGGTQTITYPIAFTSAVYSVLLTPRGGASGTAAGVDSVNTVTVSSFLLVRSSAGTRSFYWTAIGY